MTNATAKILIVEDNKLAQKMAVMTIAKLGYQADVAANGISAIQQCKNNQYALIFMDIGLPDMDGFAVTQAIRSLALAQHTPIVALTAHDGQDYHAKAEQVAMNGFFTKPLTEQVAKEILDKYLS